MVSTIEYAIGCSEASILIFYVSTRVYLSNAFIILAVIKFFLIFCRERYFIGSIFLLQELVKVS